VSTNSEVCIFTQPSTQHPIRDSICPVKFQAGKQDISTVSPTLTVRWVLFA
jgi:hypothetical protein